MNGVEIHSLVQSRAGPGEFFLFYFCRQEDDAPEEEGGENRMCEKNEK